MTCTEQQFLKDVADHNMTVLRDDGINRHVQFRRPNTSCMGFDLVTWSGYLCYSGDMGTYVFSRIPDMFEFFRRPDDSYRIDMGYWSEKCLAADRDGIAEYSADKFRERITEWLNDRDASTAVREAVREEVLPRADDGEYEARRAARDFSEEGFEFTDFWECNLHEFTYRFVWCCYALAWGIRKYDQERKT